MKRPRVITATEAAKLIPDHVTLATGGFLDFGFVGDVAAAIEARFKSEARPNGLTLVHAAGQARIGHFAHAGMLKRVIAGYFGWSKEMQRLVLENEIEGYNWPQGVIINMYRELAAGRKWHHSNVGMNTFVETSGGGLNTSSPGWWVKPDNGPIKWGVLRYECRPIHVALIRASSCDPHGNLTMENERLTLETLHLAMAARNSGGMVIAQVDSQRSGRSDPMRVKVPHVLVDYIVETDHKIVVTSAAQDFDLVKRKIAARAAREIRDGDIVNLGIGLPEAIVGALGRRVDEVVLTTESGAIGGVPLSGKNFGSSHDMDCVLDANYQFDFYNGGGLDIAFLGFAEIDLAGNVNVSKFSGRLPGCGGFIDISQSAKRVVFIGKEMAGGKSKFVDQVEHLTFSAAHALARGCDVTYVTDNAVYKLTKSGLEKAE